MSARFRVLPAPVGQQAPPARAAASGSEPLRDARGSLLLTTGTASRRDTSQNRILELDARAWEEGYRAGRLGISKVKPPALPSPNPVLDVCYKH
jgi:hypothetical protein